MRTWKVVSALLALTTLIGLVGIWTEAPLVAQVRAALVRDVDHPTQQPARIYMTANVQSGQYGGFAVAAPVPAGKRLVIQSVSVFGYSYGSERITAVWLTTSQIGTYVSLDPQTTEGKVFGDAFPGLYAITYNRNIDFVFEPGETPRVEMWANTASTSSKYVNVFLHGYYVTL